MAQFSGAAASLGAQGRANQPSKQGGGGASPIGGRGMIGSGSGGGRASSALNVQSVKGSTKPKLTVFEKASRGLPMDDDELAQLTPEQRAAWEAQRASAMLGVQ